MDSEVLSPKPSTVPAPSTAPAPAATHKPRKAHHVQVAHATHGRVRLKVPAGKSDPKLLHMIKSTYEGHEGIRSISVGETTGSLTIAYDPVHHPDLGALFSKLGNHHDAPLTLPPPTEIDRDLTEIEEEAEFLAEHSAIARVLVDHAKAADQWVKRTTNNNLDLKILVPIALATITFMEIGALGPTPMWVTLCIFSINHFVALHARDGQIATEA